MAVSYKRLWKLLIDRDLKKKDLIELCDISGYTVTRLTRGENISAETLAKALNVGFDDIMEITDSTEEK